ncbi:MAG TPA: hypothetical protein VNT76_23405 [Candidatus Binatus sp.]|nr:hypothetical protein [Candidatus Binatus sp.]
MQRSFLAIGVTRERAGAEPLGVVPVSDGLKGSHPDCAPGLLDGTANDGAG